MLYLWKTVCDILEPLRYACPGSVMAAFLCLWLYFRVAKNLEALSAWIWKGLGHLLALLGMDTFISFAACSLCHCCQCASPVSGAASHSEEPHRQQNFSFQDGDGEDALWSGWGLPPSLLEGDSAAGWFGVCLLSTSCVMG